MQEMEIEGGRQACVVPVRRRRGRIEFCLVTRGADSRWSFPVAQTPAEDAGFGDALRELIELAGLEGDVELQNPLGHFRTSRAQQAGDVTAYLVRVRGECGDRSDLPVRRRWCLPEEARMRIRRKPMRRLLDAALHRIEGAQDDPTDGESGPGRHADPSSKKGGHK